MERRDWLLLFIGAPSDVEFPRLLSPIRIMKGMFLLSKEGGDAVTDVYEFEPFHYGPCSFGVYDDLADLVTDGLIVGNPVPGYSWLEYEVTSEGRALMDRLISEIDPELLARLKEIKTLVSSLGFRRLLHLVYTKYPDSAVNSVLLQR